MNQKKTRADVAEHSRQGGGMVNTTNASVWPGVSSAIFAIVYARNSRPEVSREVTAGLTGLSQCASRYVSMVNRVICTDHIFVYRRYRSFCSLSVSSRSMLPDSSRRCVAPSLRTLPGSQLQPSSLSRREGKLGCDNKHAITTRPPTRRPCTGQPTSLC